jgi:ribonuclease PH|tara:strand:+ start:868 stop:1122 length:255 start_codon:yes stop_codon:yes gene_type:complete
MIITIRNESGETVYDVSKIENNDTQLNANVSINKMGTLNTIVEALNFATQGHQGQLETLLADCPEAVVETPTEEEEETSTEEDS